jgi:hypothetical protein
MTEFDEIAESMRDAFLAWIRDEDRELTNYAARRFVTRQMPDETLTICENVAVSLYESAWAHVNAQLIRARVQEMNHPLAGSW